MQDSIAESMAQARAVPLGGGVGSLRVPVEAEAVAALDDAPCEEVDCYGREDDGFERVEAAHLVGAEHQEGCRDDGVEDEAEELLHGYALGFGDCVRELVPVIAEDTAEKDGEEVSTLHHQDGGPDLSDEETDHDGEEAAVHAPHDSAFDGKATVQSCADFGMPRYDDGAEQVGDEDADYGLVVLEW